MKSSRFSGVTPVVEAFSERVAFEIPSNISEEFPCKTTNDLNHYQSLLGLSVTVTDISVCFLLFYAFLFFSVNESFVLSFV